MLSQQELSDRLEIQDLVFHYADLIDQKRFDELREAVFTEDAFIDYSVFGGSVGDLETTIAFLKEAVYADEGVSDNELRDLVRSKLAAFKVPEHVKIFTEPLPKNATGKVLKKAIRQAWIDQG